MRLEGTVITDGAWKQYPGQGITPEYDDPDIYQKVRLEPFIILYPGMNISVSSPDQTARRILVREIDIKKVKGLKEYIDFKNQFEIDKGNFEYISFMNLQFWEFELQQHPKTNGKIITFKGYFHFINVLILMINDCGDDQYDGVFESTIYKNSNDGTLSRDFILTRL